MHEIECDGRIVTTSRDPPGQRSSYIAPGNPDRETYRLSTFHDFPSESPIDPRQFSSNGFYYTGYGDRVKCFSCGQCSEHWLPGDDISSSEWHQSNCDFINGRETGNVPILSLLRQHQSTQRSGETYSLNRNSPVQHPQNSSASGINSVNTPVQSSFNSSPPSTNHSTVFGHPETTHFSSYSIRGADYGNSSITENGISITNEGRSSQENFRGVFPCIHPLNPHMRTKEARLQTFLDNSNFWPAHRISATPQQIVDAGMYYLGERDRVKCWYCNGGLQNWEQDDDPWEEHAKWFPLCEYVLQQKGPEYVHRIVARFPGLRRPNLHNPSSGEGAQSLVRVLHSRGTHTDPSPQQNHVISQPVIVDPRQEIEERNRNIEEEMRSSEDVSQARLMGFSDDEIKIALLRKYASANHGFSSFQELVEELVSVPENDDSTGNNVQEVAAALPTSSSESVTSLSPIQEMRRLQEARRCKKCHREVACMVFIPCGHLASCLGCSNQLTSCPICGEFIREKVRSYLS